MQRKPAHATTKLTPFTVSKDEWNTKEDTGKSLKNALHALRYDCWGACYVAFCSGILSIFTKRMFVMLCISKGTSQAEATLNSEKIKPIALAVIELHASGS